MAFEDGPYIQAACFCEMVIEDKTGALSLIRVIDTITHTERGPSPPEAMPPIQYPIKLVLMLKSGMARGRSTIKVVPEEPDGSTDNPFFVTVHFEGDEKGQNAVVEVRYTFKHEGLYWFNVYIEDQKITAIPMRVKYNRMIIGSTSG